jgi:hypothetical protein
MGDPKLGPHVAETLAWRLLVDLVRGRCLSKTRQMMVIIDAREPTEIVGP